MMIDRLPALRLAAEHELREGILPFWETRAVDRDGGGFFGRIGADGRPDSSACASPSPRTPPSARSRAATRWWRTQRVRWAVKFASLAILKKSANLMEKSPAFLSIRGSF